MSSKEASSESYLSELIQGSSGADEARTLKLNESSSQKELAIEQEQANHTSNETHDQANQKEQEEELTKRSIARIFLKKEITCIKEKEKPAPSLQPKGAGRRTN
ncbi:hypothetical protein KFK09_007327 [Dendrobium nobile]|uniref:Uncharacterized protein n=1 Tax=Dendrobium nobile TaxID=94219 RepID=A0A8T3BUV7_DENNO|nr:hypothetical protein KFK09_007327 [Dendrobium nobile]